MTTKNSKLKKTKKPAKSGTFHLNEQTFIAIIALLAVIIIVGAVLFCFGIAYLANGHVLPGIMMTLIGFVLLGTTVLGGK